MKKLIFHVDVNSAYLSWEAVYRLKNGDKLDLRKIPSAIGGDSKARRGVILAKSIPCKKYGIKSGETVYSAKSKCPDILIVPPRFEIYKIASDKMNRILKEYSDNIQKYSIDESFLDMTHTIQFNDNPRIIADEIRNRIYNELGFTVCVGISENKLLAKMATDLRKPNFTNTLFLEEIEKMWDLPVGDLFMVGKKTEEKLNLVGINTIGELAKYKGNYLTQTLKKHGTMIQKFANGIDDSDVCRDRVKEKGIGNSTTTREDIKDKETAYTYLLSLCESVGSRIRERNLKAGVICVSLKNSEFKSYSHQMKIGIPTNSTMELYNFSKKLFDEVWRKEGIRHIGVRVGALKEKAFEQISLFDCDMENSKKENLDSAIDKIRERFGNDVITRGSISNLKNQYN